MDRMTFQCASYIKEIGRGKDGARSLSTEDAQLVFSAVLDGAVSDVELGALLVAYRVKGESAAELVGMLRAVDAHVAPMPPSAKPVLVIPSYNGARNLPNLVPLLAGLAARAGLNVLVHGITEDASMWGTERVTTHDVWHALNWPVVFDAAGMQQAFTQHGLAFMPIDALCPSIDRLLSLRRVLGVRNSSHTLVKLIQPFGADGLLLAAYTHPEYGSTLSELFLLNGQRAILMRGTEGEAVANPRKPARMDGFEAGTQRVLFSPEDAGHDMIALPARAAEATAAYIRRVLDHDLAAPVAITRQVAICRAAMSEAVL
jgi:anthranilate phosphoribosyltransferase